METEVIQNSSQKFRTVVFGASLKAYRYSHRAVKILKINGYDVVPIGLSKGEIDSIPILTGHPQLAEIHTVTMYLNQSRQKEHYDYILSLTPKRIIFNPGAENPEFTKLARAEGVHCENACTLVLLSTDQYEHMPSEGQG